MNEAQDRKLLEVMDTVARGEWPEASEYDPEVRDTVEALGLLPYALEPTSGLKSLPEMPPREDMPSPAAVVRPSFGTSSRSGRSLYAAAAVIAMALIGASIYLGVALRDRELQIAYLEGQLSVVGVGDPSLEEAQVEIRELQRHLQLVTNTGVGICPLHATDETPAGLEIRGTLYVAGAEGWYLIADGLEPAAREQTYTVWFLLEDGPAKAGILEVPEVGRAELMAEGFPEGSKGVIVTLESSASVDRPEGPQMLYGDAADMIRL